MKTVKSDLSLLLRLHRLYSLAAVAAVAASCDLYSAVTRCDTQSPSEFEQRLTQQRLLNWQQSSQTLLAADGVGLVEVYDVNAY